MVRLVLVCLLMPGIRAFAHEPFEESRPDRRVAPSRLPEASIPARLTLRKALEIFRSYGLDLLLADAAVDSARADERLAAAIANPQVTLGAGRSGGGYDPREACGTDAEGMPIPGCSAKQVSAGLSDQAAFLDLLSGKRRLRIRSARAALAGARLSRADVERTVGLAVKQQYAAAVLAQAALDFAGQSRASAEQTLHLVEVRYKAGAVSEADVARAEAAKLEAEQAADQAEQSLQQAKVGLAFLLGVRSETGHFDLGDELLSASVPATLVDSSREDLLRLGLAERPDLKAIRAQEERARASLSLARRQRLPDVALSLQYVKEGEGSHAIQPPTTSLNLALAVPVFNQNQGAIAKAEADLRTQELQEAKVQAQVRSDVGGAFFGFVGAKKRAQRMESRLLERTERARDLVRTQYEKGAASLLELLDAQRTFIAANIEHLQNLNDYWTAVFQLEAAVGRELRE